MMRRILNLWVLNLLLIAGGMGTALSVDSSYVLRPGDGLLITVFEQEEFTTETQVSKAGEIEMPLLGTVVVGGKSIKDAVADLTERLSKGFVVDPKVTLTVTSGGVDIAIVVGMVNEPGPVEFPSQRRLDALSAIAMAGGFTELADLRRVSIRRDVDGKSVVLDVDVRKITGEDPTPLLLEPDDIVSVGQALEQRVTVMGEVEKPGFVDIPVDGELNLLSAIAIAGGYRELADATHVVVRRGDSILRLDADALANKPGQAQFFVTVRDVIIVGKLPLQTVTLMGEVKSPGMIEIPVDTGLTLLDAIAVGGGYTPNANTKRIVIRRRAMADGEEDKFYQVNGRRLAEDAEAKPVFLQPGDVITVSERFF